MRLMRCYVPIQVTSRVPYLVVFSIACDVDLRGWSHSSSLIVFVVEDEYGSMDAVVLEITVPSMISRVVPIVMLAPNLLAAHGM